MTNAEKYLKSNYFTVEDELTRKLFKVINKELKEKNPNICEAILLFWEEEYNFYD